MIGQIAERRLCIYVGSKHNSYPGVVSIKVDDKAGVTFALDHLLELGHTLIAHLAGNHEPSSHGRASAYRRIMRKAA